MKVGVIGAGPAGITAAYQLAKAGAEVDVFEASPHVGGMSRTIQLWGQRVDLGPHRFLSSDARVNRLWLEVVGRDYQMVERLTRIYYRGHFFDYPLRPFNAVANLGPLEAARCVASYALHHRRSVPEEANFEEWVTARFGRRLFEIFFKTYSEKLWGIPCAELDSDFAAQRIRSLSLAQAIWHSLGLGRRGTHKTLAQRFAYPNGGTGSVYERMAAAIRARGGRLHLETKVKQALVREGRVAGLGLLSGESPRFDAVISTMPLTLLVDGLPEAPPDVRQAARSLTFRNTILVYVHVDAPDLFPDNWLYVHSADLRMGRITNFRNWAKALYGGARTTILALEYWCSFEDELWDEPDDRLVALASAELERTGLLRGAKVLAGHVVRLPRCYPVYRRGYREQLGVVERYLRTVQGLLPIGRYGAFKYNNQDHSILMGLLAAENVLGQASHDLWAINTDYETYQEGATITETGLEPGGRPG